ncbi:DUF2285 domain-containing protein [Azoarcus olearius]|uniref:Uncharacterized protein n=1 Tax=Azoarcus sp. (strain BH72) TaxID=418699 RepID=A1K6M6_AZOSB|nr:DUF2285 domain-containing protein [Azoarcus olearius]CAL94481.1 Hypothetical protein azo1864 [Azoarcus olearius]
MIGDSIDWRDAAHYPTEATPHWWAWQFLRRNREYQADYAEWSAAFAQYLADFDNIDRPDETPFLERWGIHVLWDPAEPDQHLVSLDTCLPKQIHHAMERPRLHEAVMKFDLRYPIDRQIEYAKGQLMEQAAGLQRTYISRGSVPVKFSAKGPHKRKLPEYLRALDASLAGAKVREIAEVLYPHLARELTRDAGMVRAEDALARGRELADSGYRDLIVWL